MKTINLAPLLVAAAGTIVSGSLHADTFGSGANTFTIDFVTIGNPGNGDDLGAGGGVYSSPHGGVGYIYRMGVTEAAQDWITRTVNLGLMGVTAGAWTGSRPAGNVTWVEAAAFVNWLNISTGHQPAYSLSFNTLAQRWDMALWSSEEAWQLDGENPYRHKNSHYFLPREDEWYKAAYHKNDGVTANYWDYATGSNSIPTPVASGEGMGTAVFGSFTSPAAVDDDGGLSPYGTRGQNGNVWEWQENAFVPIDFNVVAARAGRGGSFGAAESNLRPSARSGNLPDASYPFMGFRVASIPEPSSALLLASASPLLLLRRRR